MKQMSYEIYCKRLSDVYCRYTLLQGKLLFTIVSSKVHHNMYAYNDYIGHITKTFSSLSLVQSCIKPSIIIFRSITFSCYILFSSISHSSSKLLIYSYTNWCQTFKLSFFHGLQCPLACLTRLPSHQLQFSTQQKSNHAKSEKKQPSEQLSQIYTFD